MIYVVYYIAFSSYIFQHFNLLKYGEIGSPEDYDSQFMHVESKMPKE